MTKEVEDLVDEDPKQKKNFLKKTPSNHISPDDIEFDDPEYLEMFRRQEVAMKNKKMNEELEKANKEEETESENEETEELEQEDNTENEEDENDPITLEDDNENESVEKSEINQFKNEKWIKDFENICLKMNQKTIDSRQFETFLKSLIQKLDPSRDENNKKRLCLLTENLILFYQSLFRFKTPSDISIDTNLANMLTKYIYDFTYKYGNKSTKKDPSPFIAIFKRILDNLNKEFLSLKINERKIPQLDIVSKFHINFYLFKKKKNSRFMIKILKPELKTRLNNSLTTNLD